MSSDISKVISVDKALEVCGDMEFLMELIDMFRTDIEECKPLLREAHVNKDAESIKKISHRIKGQALSLECTDLSSKCDSLEKSAASGKYLVEFPNCIERYDGAICVSGALQGASLDVIHNQAIFVSSQYNIISF